MGRVLEIFAGGVVCVGVVWVCHCAYRYDHGCHSGTETAAEAIARHRFAIQPGGEVAGLMVQLRSSRK